MQKKYPLSKKSSSQQNKVKQEQKQDEPSLHVLQNILSYAKALQCFKHENMQFQFLLN